MKSHLVEMPLQTPFLLLLSIIFRRRWKFIGHVLRMDPAKHLKTASTWTPEERRSRGRPKETWSRTVKKERIALGFGSWREATAAARDRLAWRRRVSGPIPIKGYSRMMRTTLDRRLFSLLRFRRSH